MANARMVNVLYEAIYAAVSDVEKEHAFSRGDVMSAALHFMVETGLSEPGDTAEILTREVHSALASAIQDHREGALS